MSLPRHFVLASVIACAGCSAAEQGELPPEIPDPTAVQTSAGALAFYRKVTLRLAEVLDPIVVDAGLLTDELAALPLPFLIGGRYSALDSREDGAAAVATVAGGHWAGLHKLRAQAREARGFVAAYASDADTAIAKVALIGHLYALEAYAEIFLADLFCSGIPLSTVDYGGDYTLAAGSTTPQIYAHAVALFDTALARLDAAAAAGADSVRLRHFAAVGRGRALLALGRFADAAAAVAAVPDDYRYEASFGNPEQPDTVALYRVARERTLPLGPGNDFLTSAGGAPSVGDREGGNGLDYRSSNDPRVAAVLLGTDARGHAMYLPRKYLMERVLTDDAGNPIDTTYEVAPPLTFTVASGVEARLIEAEAALQGGGDWLAKLNGLRRTALPDTVLPDLVDPGTAAARVDSLFRERAFWLYLTGHRQGDLRRLIRDPAYFREPNAVYPTGAYTGNKGVYGNAVVLQPPESEQDFNPKYTGCVHLGA